MYPNQQNRSPDRDDGDEVIRIAAAHFRAPLPIDPDFDTQIMTAVRAEARIARTGDRHRRRLAWGWWMSVALVPVAALVLLAVRSQIGTSHTGVTNRSTRALSTTVANSSTMTATHTPLVLQNVRFEFVTPEVHDVQRITIVGSFNRWDTSVTPLRSIGRGHWIAEISLLPGRYTYQFVINGRRWVPDPSAPRDAGSDFGTSNSVITVPEGRTT